MLCVARWKRTSFCQCFIQVNLHILYISPRKSKRRSVKAREEKRGEEGEQELKILQMKNSVEKVLCVLSSPSWWPS